MHPSPDVVEACGPGATHPVCAKDACATACRAAQVLAATAAAIGGLVLAGWAVHPPLVTGFIPGLVPMMPLTAVGLLATATALWIDACGGVTRWRRGLCLAAALVAVLVGGLILAEYGSGRDLGIDRLLFPTAVAQAWPNLPGRPSPYTAAAMVLLGLGLAALPPARRGVGRGWPLAAGLCAAALAYLVLVAYLYDPAALYAWMGIQPVALLSAVSILLLAFGLVLVAPGRGFRALIDDGGPAGTVARRLLPATLVGPVAIGWLRLEVTRFGFLPVPIGVGFLVVCMVAGGLGFLWWSASLYARTEALRDQFEAAMRRKDAELSDLYEHAAVGYHSLDADGVFVRVNATELAWLGYTRDEVVGRLRFSDVITPSGHATFEESFPRLKAEGVVRDLPFVLRRKDGSTFPVLVSASALVDEAGRFVASRSVAYDMTERRRLEAALARQTVETEQAQAHAAAQDFLLSTISHELKTPLSLIQGYAELLEERHRGDPLLDGMLEGTQRLATHVGRIVDAAALLGGGMPLYRQPIAPCELVEPLQERVAPATAKAGLTLLIDVPPDLPSIDVDAPRLVQALAELVDNARRVTPAGGTIAVRGRAADGQLELLVADNGPGIPQGQRACAWQAFTQVGAGGARRSGGLGLGLAIVKGIVELHGGSVAMTCPPEGGTQVGIRLPAVPARVTPRLPARPDRV